MATESTLFLSQLQITDHGTEDNIILQMTVHGHINDYTCYATGAGDITVTEVIR